VLWLFLQRKTQLLSQPAKVLHFAPEPFLSARLQRIHGSHYTSGDLDGALAMESIDITQIDKADGAFDAIIVSHVLEHVPADVQAMQEIKRVLAPGSIAVLQHPIEFGRALSYEDSAIVDPEARERAFGQADHVRIYGRDFDARLTSAGLSFSHFPITSIAEESEIVRFRLGDPNSPQRGSDIYLCK